jgi:molybdate transport system substrate-binding protein
VRDRRPALSGLLVSVLAVSGCVGASPGDSSAEDGEVTLDVLAAASLTEPFEQLASDFEESRPGVSVRLSFGSSASLAQLVREGAPADVLATADRASMDLASDSVDDPVEFATNELTLVTAAGASGIGSLADLGGDVPFVTCVESAPCGALATELLARNGVTAEPVSRETDVKAVLTKVAAGEVDAGFVYVTDARAAGDAVSTVEVPGAEDLPNPYLIAPVAASAQQELADAWVDTVLGPRGRRTLADAGFGDPGGTAP